VNYSRLCCGCPNLYRHTLEKFSDEPPTTMTALLDCLLPDIERALRSGKRLNEVWQRLSEDGLDISRETFCRLVRRARKKNRPTAASGGWGKDNRPSDSQCSPNADIPTLEALDPLANHWRATPRRSAPARGTANLYRATTAGRGCQRASRVRPQDLIAVEVLPLWCVPSRAN
jgi:hypothetical protein